MGAPRPSRERADPSTHGLRLSKFTIIDHDVCTALFCLSVINESQDHVLSKNPRSVTMASSVPLSLAHDLENESGDGAWTCLPLSKVTRAHSISENLN